MIKKALFILICVVLATTSFAQKGKYSIKCTVDDPALDGIYAVLQIHLPNGDWRIDSCMVRKGKFSFKGEVEGKTTADIVFREYRQESPYLFNFILEPGTLYIDHINKYDYDITLRGTPLNDALNAYFQADRADSLSCTLRKAYGDFLVRVEIFQADTVQSEQALLIYKKNIILLSPVPELKMHVAKEDSVFFRAQKHRVQRLWNLYHQNEHNLLACYAIEQLIYYDENFQHYNFVDSLLRTTDTLVVKKLGHKLDYLRNKLKHKLDYLREKENTSPGMPYVDIPGVVAVYSDEHWVETAGSLKDLIDGKLAVVNFRSTRCFSCSQEIRETIVPLYNNYKDSGLVVVGIVSWDTSKTFYQNFDIGFSTWNAWENFDDIYHDIANMHIKYPQLKADSVDAALIYGLEDLPETILIAPDGTILARDLHGPSIEKAILKALKKEE